MQPRNIQVLYKSLLLSYSVETMWFFYYYFSAWIMNYHVFLMELTLRASCHRYALTEMGHDVPDLPIGMLTDLHLKRG
jgi:hypothetical protein